MQNQIIFQLLLDTLSPKKPKNNKQWRKNRMYFEEYLENGEEFFLMVIHLIKLILMCEYYGVSHIPFFISSSSFRKRALLQWLQRSLRQRFWQLNDQLHGNLQVYLDCKHKKSIAQLRRRMNTEEIPACHTHVWLIYYDIIIRLIKNIDFLSTAKNHPPRLYTD